MTDQEGTVFSIRRTHSLDAQPNGKLRESRQVEAVLNYDALRTGWLARFASDRQGKGALSVLLALALHCRFLEGADFEQLQKWGLVTDNDEERLFCRVTNLGLADELGTTRKAVARAVDWLNEQHIIQVLKIPNDARGKDGYYRDSGGQFKGNAIYLLAADDVLTTVPTDSNETVSDDDSPTVGRDDTRPEITVCCDDPPTVGCDDPCRGSSRRTKMHACMDNNDNNNAPTRRSHTLTVKALTSQYPVQPDGLSPDHAFNLALDKALALLPAKLRKRADAPLYALAGELHPTAREHPSRAWPDAGGAGWILDAVLDATAKGPVGSVNLIRTITDRWLAEGNPYAVKPLPVDDPLAVFARQLADDDYTPSDRDHRHLFDLHAEGYSDDEIVAGIQRAVAGARQRGAVPRSFGYCVPAVREIPPSQPSRAAMHDRGAVPGAVTRTGEKATAVPTDPVLAEVVGMYESEIGSVTERTVQRLMALTEEHRDIGKWRAAFDAVVQSNVRRLDYLVKCLENAGKPKPRPKPGRGGGYQRPQRTIREKPPAEDVDAETRARQRAALAELKERQLSQPSRRQ